MRQSVPDCIKEYVDHAAQFERNDQYDKAIDVLRQALTLYPNIAVLHNNLGCALANQRKYEEAKNEFLQAITLTVANHHVGIVTPESYPQEPEQNLRAIESYTKGAGHVTLPARMPNTGLPLQLASSRKRVIKIPEKVEFKFLDLLPLFAVWNEKNKSLIRSFLALGFICGALVGYIIGFSSWGQPFFYALYFGISVEAYTFVSAIKIVEKRHYGETNVWLSPWLKITYWLFFSLLFEGTVLLLETINSGTPWLTIVISSKLPNGIAYSNTLNAILIGVIFAFPSKIILQILSNLFNVNFPLPFSELAENVIEKYNEPILTFSSEGKENSAK